MKNILNAIGICLIGLLIFYSYIYTQGAKAMTQQNTLTTKQQRIASIAALTAVGDIPNLKKSLAEGLNQGLNVNEIKEVLVQMYAYAGFPRALNGLGTFMEVLNERRANGIEDIEGIQGKELPNDTDKFAYGNQVQIDLTGAPVKGGLMDFAPAIDSFLKEHLFADIFGRGVLSYQDREIATIAALAAMTGVQSQLKSHITIGMNTGLSAGQIDEIIHIINTSIGETQATVATQILEGILKEKKQ